MSLYGSKRAGAGVSTEDMDREKTGHGRYLDALNIVLKESCAEQGGLFSTKELQLTSLALCVECRNVSTLHVRVGRETPRQLWATCAGHSSSWMLGAGRVPLLRPRAVTWMACASAEFMSDRNDLLSNVEYVQFGPEFQISLKNVVWPERVRRISAGKYPVDDTEATFGQEMGRWSVEEMERWGVEEMVWPGSLEELTLPSLFNQPIEGMTWPGSLEKLAFGRVFDKPVEKVSWPASLLQLTFGEWFNRPIRGVTWPASLQQVTFGKAFRQAIEGVAWPASLLQLTFGEWFNQPIEGVVWPSSLQQLTFGEWFNQPIEGVVWPVSLQVLTFGGDFDEPIEGAIWSESLQQVNFGKNFNQPIERVAWPPSLQRLTFGADFNQPITDTIWPVSLEEVTFGWSFDQGIEEVTWPDSLLEMTFGERFCQPIEGVVWPASLQQLAFGWFFNQPIECVAWPKFLRKLTIGDRFNQPIERVAWPDSLQHLAFGRGFIHYIGGVVWPASLQQVRFGRVMDEDFLMNIDWPTSVQKVISAEFELVLNTSEESEGASATSEEALAVDGVRSVRADPSLPQRSCTSEAVEPVTPEVTAPLYQTRETPTRRRQELMASAVADVFPEVSEQAGCMEAVVCWKGVGTSSEAAEGAAEWSVSERADETVAGEMFLRAGEAMREEAMDFIGMREGESALEPQGRASVSPALVQGGLQGDTGGREILVEKEKEEEVENQKATRSMEGESGLEARGRTPASPVRPQEGVRGSTGGREIFVEKEKEEEEEEVGNQGSATSTEEESGLEARGRTPASPVRPQEGMRSSTGAREILAEKEKEEEVGNQKATRSMEGESGLEARGRTPASLVRPQEGVWGSTGGREIPIEKKKEEEEEEEEEVGNQGSATSTEGESGLEARGRTPASPVRPQEGMRGSTGAREILAEKEKEEEVGNQGSAMSTEGDSGLEARGRTPASPVRPQEGVLAEGEEDDHEEEAANQEPTANRGRQSWRWRIVKAAVASMLAVCGGVISRVGSRSKPVDVLGAGVHSPGKRFFPHFGRRLSMTQEKSVQTSRTWGGMATTNKVLVAVDVPEGQRPDGFLCNVERLAQQMTGQAEVEYQLRANNGELVLGSGRFCRVFSTQVPESITDRLGLGKRGGEVLNARGVYNRAGDFEVVSRWGWVLWSTAHPDGKRWGGWKWWRPRKRVNGETSALRGNRRRW